MLSIHLPQLNVYSYLLLFFVYLPIQSFSQTDTIKQIIEDVLVKVYEQSSPVREIPAAVNHIGGQTLLRFNNNNILQAVNTTAGIQMQERSPGSYRFNIRGSSLRSPFGVRNVKVYYNDVPVTDPGGNTYLNQFGFHNYNSLTVIKGPGSSLYGAGTGGVILIDAMNENEKPSVTVQYTAGSYGTKNIQGSLSMGNEKNINRVSYQLQQSDGHRNHSASKREVLSWDGLYRFADGKILKTTFLYGRLFYQTPGALTRNEYETNARASRPAAGAFLSAQDQQASITQKTFIAGVSYEQTVVKNVVSKSVVYGMFTELRNPAIQNYGRNSEPHLGGRTTLKFDKPMGIATLSVVAGGELQQGFATFSVFKNVRGNADSLRTNDEVSNSQSVIFTQATFTNRNWIITAGGSLNLMKVKFERFSPASLGKQQATFNNQLASRVSVMKKFKTFNIYTSLSKGFSPPATAELLPTGGAINLGLKAEEGLNYDVGLKGRIYKMRFDVNAFIFSLNNTIVLRRNAGGGDFYINAGKTKQHGIETAITYPVIGSSKLDAMFWLSHTWHNFHYKEFKRLTEDFSGKQMPGEAPHTFSTGFDMNFKNRFTATLSEYYSGKVPLNDANTELATSYHLLGLKLGYNLAKSKMQVKFIVGADNLLNEKYSLGNDINGFGGRYYNVAAARNYYASVIIQLFIKSAKSN